MIVPWTAIKLFNKTKNWKKLSLVRTFETKVINVCVHDKDDDIHGQKPTFVMLMVRAALSRLPWHCVAS